MATCCVGPLTVVSQLHPRCQLRYWHLAGSAFLLMSFICRMWHRSAWRGTFYFPPVTLYTNHHAYLMLQITRWTHTPPPVPMCSCFSDTERDSNPTTNLGDFVGKRTSVCHMIMKLHRLGTMSNRYCSWGFGIMTPHRDTVLKARRLDW